jgi:hypothetical protein
MNREFNSSLPFWHCPYALSTSGLEEQKTEEKSGTEIEKGRTPILRPVNDKETK